MNYNLVDSAVGYFHILSSLETLWDTSELKNMSRKMNVWDFFPEILGAILASVEGALPFNLH